MRPATVVMLAIAVVCAGIAAFLMRNLLSTNSAAPTAAVVTPSIPLKKVVVASKDIKAGDRLTAEALKEVSWPGENLPKGAFLSKEMLTRSGEERIAASTIMQEEPILPSKLIGSSDMALAGRLLNGMSGVTIKVNEAGSVSGFAQPEDRVDVLMTQTERAGEGATPIKAYTVTLIRNVRVLAVDQQIQRKTQAQPPKTVTLETSPEDAKKLILAGSIGQLSLTLNRGDSSDISNTGITDIGALLEHSAPNGSSAGQIDPIITVTRSVERKEYKVPQELRR